MLNLHKKKVIFADYASLLMITFTKTPNNRLKDELKTKSPATRGG
ncbi:hypothetical protein [Xenorhabdus sp. IM139775]|nr:hypothetical protein [Xenorhabdus sp. IM139775]MDC9592971.1 hypothetical protein [Xenorhabdus sp. IM139775]